MSYLPFPENLHALSDDDLGRWLLNSFGYGVARDHGVPDDQIPEAFLENFADALSGIEVNNAENAAVVGALRRAAKGEFAIAGKVLREYLYAGAIATKFIPIGVNRSRQAAKFGKDGAQEKRAIGAVNRLKVLTAAQAILAARVRPPTDRELARLVAEKINMPTATVRTHLTALRKAKKLD